MYYIRFMIFVFLINEIWRAKFGPLIVFKIHFIALNIIIVSLNIILEGDNNLIIISFFI